MMKKRNEEGYVLIYVMVVIFVVCSIAVALMSYSLNTIQTQENMVQRMQDKYEAMGEIERLVAEISAVSESVNTIPESFSPSAYQCTPCVCHAVARDNLYSYLVDLEDNPSSLDIECIAITDSDYMFSITISYASINTTVLVKADFSSECYLVDTLEPDSENAYYYSYTLDVTDVVFDSYTIGGAT